MNRDSILRELNNLVNRTPTAIMMTGTNPIAPGCPTRGVFSCGTWGSTTKHFSWEAGRTPEGWDALVEDEAEHGDCSLNYVIIYDSDGKGYCVSLGDDCYTPLIEPPRRSDMEDLADYLADDDW